MTAAHRHPSRGGGGAAACGGAWTGWRPTHLLGTQVSGKTLGLVGMGRIARAVAKGASWLRHEGHLSRPLSAAARCGPLARAPSRESARAGAGGGGFRLPPLSGHAGDPALDERGPAGAAAGSVSDQHRAGRRGGRGRPWQRSERGAWRVPGSTSRARAAGLPELLAMENVVLLPHLGSATRETRVAMGMRALENLRLFSRASPPGQGRVTQAGLQPFAAGALPSPRSGRRQRGGVRHRSRRAASGPLLELVRLRQPDIEPVLRGEGDVAV